MASFSTFYQFNQKCLLCFGRAFLNDMVEVLTVDSPLKFISSETSDKYDQNHFSMADIRSLLMCTYEILIENKTTDRVVLCIHLIQMVLIPNELIYT